MSEKISVEEMKRAEEMMSDTEKKQSEIRESTLKELAEARGNYLTVMRARDLGIPEEEIRVQMTRSFAAELKETGGNPEILSMIYRIAKNSHILSEEEVGKIALIVYSEIYKDDPNNENATFYLFGYDSEQHLWAAWENADRDAMVHERKAQNEDKEITGEKGPLAVIKSDSTLRILKNAIDGDKELSEIFYSNLNNNFNDEIGADFFGRILEGGRSLDVPALEFFEKYKIRKEDLEKLLPVKFEV